MNNFSDIIGNRTRDLPACSTVPQPTAPPRTFVQIKKKTPGREFLGRKEIHVLRKDDMVALGYVTNYTEYVLCIVYSFYAVRSIDVQR
jgi:hypothetical protein